ncbi:hypothetical protein NC653_024099 [Populus alba x Populus x berolinensis]|nr:hypothetical protein NC653_024099 [Populus alba x Populus x berolinensis]
MDKTMMSWQPERKTGIWMNVVTVGELSPFCSRILWGHWSPDGNAILAHGYGGAFHLWKNVGVDVDHWQPQKVPSGHFAAVTDIAWARSGEYMVSVSLDQTLILATCQKSSFPENLQVDVQILGANMSALGLSQKPIYVNSGVSLPLSIYAQSAMVAEIWLWQVGSWKAVGRLQAHSLTVTQMEFCRDDSMLLAVSRDRQFSVFTIKRTDRRRTRELYGLVPGNPFGHQFATGSRDKTVKIWAVEQESSVKQMMTLPQFSSSVTALSWVGIDRQSNHGLLAVGMENGLIELWSLTINKSAAATLAVRFEYFIVPRVFSESTVMEKP